MAEKYQRAQGEHPPPYAYYPYPPNFPPPLPLMQQPVQQAQARLPTHTAQFLLGMTNRLPPLTVREIAVAGMHNLLNNGSFTGFEAGEAGERKNLCTSVHSSLSVPTPGPNGATTTDATLTVNHHNLDAGDFLACVRANMEVRDNVLLGWRISNDTKSATHRLQTVEEAQLAVDTILQKIDNPNRHNEVMLKIADTLEKEKAAPAKPGPFRCGSVTHLRCDTLCSSTAHRDQSRHIVI
ncbi:hypothetical protein C8R45DRAFT_1101239 [Mycena sanguinolenta]|nr:hypothetical protein C8R45DRAFT_1101239 [Mycena sanguinolenta]